MCKNLLLFQHKPNGNNMVTWRDISTQTPALRSKHNPGHNLEADGEVKGWVDGGMGGWTETQRDDRMK